MAERVDFYVLNSDTPEARFAFACRLAEKAYKLGNQVAMRLADEAALAAMDQQLWLFRPESFLPHQAGFADQALGQSIALLLPGQELAPCDLLINLAPQPLDDLSRCQRLAEVVVQEPQVLHSTRQAYGLYKSLHLPTQTHKL